MGLRDQARRLLLHLPARRGKLCASDRGGGRFAVICEPCLCLRLAVPNSETLSEAAMAKRPSAKGSSEASKVKAVNNAYYKALSARGYGATDQNSGSGDGSIVSRWIRPSRGRRISTTCETGLARPPLVFCAACRCAPPAPRALGSDRRQSSAARIWTQGHSARPVRDRLR